MFKPARHRWLASIITFKNPSKARAAAKRLLNALKRGRYKKMKIGKGRALDIVQSLNYAANMAKASARRKNLSARERKQLRQISKIYRSAQKQASRIYERRYS